AAVHAEPPQLHPGLPRLPLPFPRRPFPRTARHDPEHVHERTRGAARDLRAAGRRATRVRTALPRVFHAGLRGPSQGAPAWRRGRLRRVRKIVYTGDTMPHEALVEIAHRADVLIHDATSDAALEEKANRYGHSSSRQAAMIAKEAGVGLLVLTHVSPRYEDPATILE